MLNPKNRGRLSLFTAQYINKSVDNHIMDSSTNIDLNVQASANSVVFPKRDPSYMARQDILDGLKAWRIWFMLAYQDIKLRYRRSVLGPFWITLSMAITVYTMGFLYAHLLHTNMQEYYPFLAAGMLSWSLISTVITDLTETFITSDNLLKQIKLPYSLYIHRVASRNVLIFFHNLAVMIPILIIFHESAKVNFYTLLLIPNMFLVYINTVTYGMILSMIGARYRDVSQIIKSLIQVAFFVTPVMWNPVVLPAQYQSIMLLNPFYIFVELIRAPLIGSANSWSVMGIALLLTLIGILISYKMFARYRARIIYWI